MNKEQPKDPAIKPKRHHYVPRCYLRNFMNGDHLYTLDIKNVQGGFQEPIKKNHPNRICIEENFYSIKPEFTGTTFKLDEYDQLFVESEVLHHLENEYRLITDKLINSDELPMNDAARLCDFLLQMKLRNPYWLKDVIEKNKVDWIETAIAQIYEVQNSAVGPFAWLPTDIRIAAVQALKNANLNNKDFGKQMQLYGLIMRSSPDSERNEKYRIALIDCQWELFTAPQEGPYFITSDNPGHGIKLDGLIYNSNFTGDFVYYFPISFRHCFAINGFVRDESYSKGMNSKMIKHTVVGDHQVIKVNNNSMQRINRLLIASDDWYLKQVRQLNQKKLPDN
ncbi:hypothetical protein DJ568_03025 [Mucilaginibacter hurinus]|uniref:DUF4238 domain-containing protein n=1 Tax=Mucilaginibacter hurinus TaxID=2201324 RepID=A0A367GVY8_9SPHI|nr:DUF4238 domain-containing protein [Mucilaginibacter hurinus]RCH56843.1 hypothetical protein DJ568_03025 [Mucilaginibacter hurinus]